MVITYGWWKGFTPQTDPRAIANAAQTAKGVVPQLDLAKLMGMKKLENTNNPEESPERQKSGDQPLPEGIVV